MARLGPRDSQRQKVYEHEWSLLEAFPDTFGRTVTMAESRKLIHQAYEHFGLTHMMPTIVQNNRRYATCVYYRSRGDGFGQIEMAGKASKSCSLWTAYVPLHEAAHGILSVQGFCPLHMQGHGPAFVKVAHELYREILGIPEKRLQMAAATKRVKILRSFPDLEKYGALYRIHFKANYGPWSILARLPELDVEKVRKMVGPFRSQLREVEALTSPF